MFSFYQAAKIVGATNAYEKFSDFELTSVEFDSRKASAGTLFVPLSGVHDGHDFYLAAKNLGAVATLWSREAAPTDLPYLQVTDTLTAMQALAKYYLAAQKVKVVAITGSNGKTTTKDLTASVLTTKFHTFKTQGNFNNHIGMPYTILSMPADTEVLVLEMGMSHAGEIKVLSELATPVAAAITLIGESHLEFFGSRLGIAQAKMEIVAGLKGAGLLLVPADEPLLTALLADVTQTVKKFQLDDPTGNNLSATIVKEEQLATTFTLNFLPGEFVIPVSGAFNVKNALVAAYFGVYFGLSAEEIARGLAQVKLTQNRSQWLEHNGIQILSDTYNANPTAMILALNNFSRFETRGKKIAVLGDMLELGATSAELHASVAGALNPTEIAEVYLYGPEMQALEKTLAKKYPASAIHYYSLDQKAQLETDVKNNLQADDYVIVKASNGMHLDQVVQKIIEK